MWMMDGIAGPRIQVTDRTTGQQSDLIELGLRADRNQRINFYTCQNAPWLYHNYEIDDTYTIVTDNMNSATVFLKSQKKSLPVGMKVSTTDDKSKGIDFTYTNYVARSVTDLTIDGISYEFDMDKPTHFLMLNSADSVSVEGFYSFYYKDNSGNSHRVAGNLKAKRIN